MMGERRQQIESWVLIAGQPGPVRDGLAALVATIPGVSVLEAAGDGEATLARLVHRPQAVVILAGGPPALELVATWKAIRRRYPDVTCLAIAGAPDQEAALQAAGIERVFIEGISPTTLIREIKTSLTPREKDMATRGS